MLRYFKKFSFYVITLIGIPALLRLIIQRKNVTIVVYHDIKPLTLEKHLSFFKKKYNVISLKQFLYAYEKRKFSQLPNYSLIITLDDGVKDNYRLLEIFKKYSVIPTIFLTSGLINTMRNFWWFHCSSDKERQEFKTIPNKIREDIMLERNFSNEKEFTERHSLTKKEIDKMKNFVDFQSHTVFHPILTMCSNRTAYKEIKESKIYLQNEIALDIYALAFPNGDYKNRETFYAKKAGYKCCLTLDVGFNSNKSDLFRLKRFCIPDDARLYELYPRVTGILDYIKTLLKNRKFRFTSIEKRNRLTIKSS